MIETIFIHLKTINIKIVPNRILVDFENIDNLYFDL